MYFLVRNMLCDIPNTLLHLAPCLLFHVHYIVNNNLSINNYVFYRNPFIFVVVGFGWCVQSKLFKVNIKICQ